MTKEQFSENLKLLLVHLREATEMLCMNRLSENYRFILEPSDRSQSDHLTEDENGFLKTWNQLRNKELSFDEVIDLLYKDGKVPKWGDCTVYRSTRDKTVVKILFSRRFRDENEIYYRERGTAPFKALVQTSSIYHKPGEKFDVNWKADLDREKSGLFYRLKSILSNLVKR